MDETAPPFTGIHAVDLSQTVAGMTATMLLADLGADVVRFDDLARDELPGEVVWNRGKRIVRHDPADERDAISGCDIVVTSDDRAAERLSPLLRDLPQVIHLDLSAILPTDHGPLAYEALLGADSGAALRQSSFGGGPIDLVVPFISYEQGIAGAAAAAAALVERERSGRGQRVLVDARHAAVLAMTTTMVLDPTAPAPMTAVGPSGPSPHYSPYRCADDQWLFLAALLPKFQQAAFAVLGISEILDDPRIAQDGSRLHDRENLYWVREKISGAMVMRPRIEWLAALRAADVPCSTIDEPESWLDHPQMEAIGQRVELVDPRVGVARMAGCPMDFALTATAAPNGRIFTDDWRWQQPARVPAGNGRYSDPDAGPLAGVKVLDLGTVVAGPLAGRILAGLGADVIKVEPLEGDGFRATGFQNNLGQRSVAMDLRSGEGHRAFLALAATADVVIDNYRPGVLKRLGITHEDLAAVNPKIITASITGFGGRGPIGDNPGFDPVLQAMSGMMAIQGGQSDPVFHTLAANDVTAAAAIALATCTALYVRASRNIGQHVSTSLAAVSAYMLSGEVLHYTSRPPVRRGGMDYAGPAATSRYYLTTNGWVRIHAESPTQLVSAGLLSGQTAAGTDDDIAGEVAAFCKLVSASELIERVHSAGGIAVKARTVADLAVDSHMTDRRYLDEIVRGDGRILRVPGACAWFSRTDLAERLRPAGLGEHSLEVLRESGMDDDAIDRLVESQVVRVGDPFLTFDVSAYR